MINTRIGLSLLSIVATLAMMAGATFAFFTDNEVSAGNTLSTGTLTIDITDQNENTPFEGEAIISNWAPGQEATANFDVVNTGSLPVNLRGFAAGSWGVQALDDQNMVKVVKVERWDGAWQVLADNPSGITGYFYYSLNGADTALFEVAPGARAQLRITIELDQNAGNEFQNEIFTASLNVDAKQIEAGSW